MHLGADFPAESKGLIAEQVQLFRMFPLIAHESELVPFQMEEFSPELRRKCYCKTADVFMILRSTVWTECIKCKNFKVFASILDRVSHEKCIIIRIKKSGAPLKMLRNELRKETNHISCAVFKTLLIYGTNC